MLNLDWTDRNNGWTYVPSYKRALDAAAQAAREFPQIDQTIVALYGRQKRATNMDEALAWEEYDAAAAWCAVRGLSGDIGCALPDGLSVRAKALIDIDPEAFALRVRQCAYARAMSRIADQD